MYATIVEEMQKQCRLEATKEALWTHQRTCIEWQRGLNIRSWKKVSANNTCSRQTVHSFSTRRLKCKGKLVTLRDAWSTNALLRKIENEHNRPRLLSEKSMTFGSVCVSFGKSFTKFTSNCSRQPRCKTQLYTRSMTHFWSRVGVTTCERCWTRALFHLSLSFCALVFLPPAFGFSLVRLWRSHTRTYINVNEYQSIYEWV